MADIRFGLLGVGNALVDVLAKTPEAFIEDQARFGMKKGMMTLIDEARATALYDAMPPGIETSGGSAGNTMAGFASCGGKGAFIGKVNSDDLGEIFAHDLKSIGIHFNTQPLQAGPKTGRCMIMVTPDAQRTMNTFLGASIQLGQDDIDEALVASSGIVYMEGYLFDPPQAKEAFIKTAQIAHAAGRKVSLTLSDPFCVDRHREDFRRLVKDHIDILFANEQEIMRLYETESFEEAAKAVAGECELTAVTRSEKGSVILTADSRTDIKAAPVARIVDTTGAGDQYAAGFLFGLSQSLPLKRCGEFGSIAAAEVISHIGPRPAQELRQLVA